MKEQIRSVVTNPDKLEVDKFDRNLTHYIKKVDQKFLRVITKLEKNNTFPPLDKATFFANWGVMKDVIYVRF